MTPEGFTSDEHADNYVMDPPTWNLKCIVLTALLAGGYWFLPRHNKWVLLALLTLPYVALAWYDHWYACKRNMGPTYLALFYGWLKPRDSKQIQAYRKWHPDIKRRVLIVDLFLLAALLATAPAFLRWNPK